MTAISAFSSSHPDVLAAYDAFNTKYRAADALMWEVVHEIEPEPKGRRTVRAWGAWLGFDPHKGETSSPPAGWRYHDDGRYGGWLVPRRNTKAGKALWARMQEVKFPDREVKFPGMPYDSAQWTLSNGEHHLYSPGVRLDERDGRTVGLLGLRDPGREGGPGALAAPQAERVPRHARGRRSTRSRGGVVTDRYRIPDPKCQHAKKAVRVTSGDLNAGPHASYWTCDREACVEDAKAWAFASTRIEPTLHHRKPQTDAQGVLL